MLTTCAFLFDKGVYNALVREQNQAHSRMESTTTCSYTTSYYTGSNDTYPYTSASICSTIGTSTDIEALASSTNAIGGSVLVSDFFLLVILVALLTGFFLDRMIGVKIRSSVFNEYLGNNSPEGKKKYHD